MSLDVLLVMLYPVVYALAVTAQLPSGDIPLNDGMWSNVAVPVLLGIGTMLIVKSFGVLAWGYVLVRLSASTPSY